MSFCPPPSLLVHFSVSQADDDSSQTPPDYTVRPNIKIHNIGELLHVTGPEHQPGGDPYLTSVTSHFPVVGCLQQNKSLFYSL